MKKKNFNKKLLFIMSGLLATTSIFAQEGGGLANIIGYAMGFLQSGYVKGFLTLAIGGCLLGMLGSRGEPGVWKKFLAPILISAGLLSLPLIVDMIFDPESAQSSEIQAIEWDINL